VVVEYLPLTDQTGAKEVEGGKKRGARPIFLSAGPRGGGGSRQFLLSLTPTRKRGPKGGDSIAAFFSYYAKDEGGKRGGGKGKWVGARSYFYSRNKGGKS